jgi:hypothetical protein
LGRQFGAVRAVERGVGYWLRRRKQAWVAGVQTATSVTISPAFLYVDVAVGVEGAACSLLHVTTSSATDLTDDTVSVVARSHTTPLPAASSLRFWPLQKRSEVVVLCNATAPSPPGFLPPAMFLSYRREQHSYMSGRSAGDSGTGKMVQKTALGALRGPSADDDASPGPYEPSRYPSPAFETLRVSAEPSGRVDVALDVFVVQRVTDGLAGNAMVGAREENRVACVGGVCPDGIELAGWSTMLRLSTPEQVPVLVYYGVGGVAALLGSIVGAATGLLAVVRSAAAPAASFFQACNARLARLRHSSSSSSALPLLAPDRPEERGVGVGGEEDQDEEFGDDQEDDDEDKDHDGDQDKDHDGDEGRGMKDGDKGSGSRGNGNGKGREEKDGGDDADADGGVVVWRLCSILREESYANDGRLCCGCPSRPWAVLAWFSSLVLATLLFFATINADTQLLSTLTNPHNDASSEVGVAATRRSLVMFTVFDVITMAAGIALSCVAPTAPLFHVLLLIFTIIPFTGGIPLLVFYSNSDQDERTGFGLIVLVNALISLAAFVCLVTLWAATVCAADAAALQVAALQTDAADDKPAPRWSARSSGHTCADACWRLERRGRSGGV